MNQLFCLFLRHEKQELHSSHCWRYRHDYLGLIVHLVDAGVSKPEPDGDDFSAFGGGDNFLYSDTFHFQVKRKSRAQASRIICFGSDVRAVFVLHLRGIRLEKHLSYHRVSNYRNDSAGDTYRGVGFPERETFGDEYHWLDRVVSRRDGDADEQEFGVCGIDQRRAFPVLRGTRSCGLFNIVSQAYKTL